MPCPTRVRGGGAAAHMGAALQRRGVGGVAPYGWGCGFPARGVGGVAPSTRGWDAGGQGRPPLRTGLWVSCAGRRGRRPLRTGENSALPMGERFVGAGDSAGPFCRKKCRDSAKHAALWGRARVPCLMRVGRGERRHTWVPPYKDGASGTPPPTDREKRCPAA